MRPMPDAPDRLDWSFRYFDELSLRDLYDALALRCEVFIVEQVAFQDPDGEDQTAWHLLGRDAAGKLQAYCRVLPPGQHYDEPSIGRVVVAPTARGTGAGWELMRHGIDELQRLWPGAAIRIGAQAHLQRFYEGCGFAVASEPYLEDGIPHLKMLRPEPVAAAEGRA
ncbi:GNAT family N-acetyltransferase [Comamonas humi]